MEARARVKRAFHDLAGSSEERPPPRHVCRKRIKHYCDGSVKNNAVCGQLGYLRDELACAMLRKAYAFPNLLRINSMSIPRAAFLLNRRRSTCQDAIFPTKEGLGTLPY